MKIRNLFFGFVLAMFLCASSFTGNTVKANACTDWCANMYNTCTSFCNGNQICMRMCRNDYNCCMEDCGFYPTSCEEGLQK